MKGLNRILTLSVFSSAFLLTACGGSSHDNNNNNAQASNPPVVAPSTPAAETSNSSSVLAEIQEQNSQELPGAVFSEDKKQQIMDETLKLVRGSITFDSLDQFSTTRDATTMIDTLQYAVLSPNGGLTGEVARMVIGVMMSGVSMAFNGSVFDLFKDGMEVPCLAGGSTTTVIKPEFFKSKMRMEFNNCKGLRKLPAVVGSAEVNIAFNEFSFELDGIEFWAPDLGLEEPAVINGSYKVSGIDFNNLGLFHDFFTTTWSFDVKDDNQPLKAAIEGSINCNILGCKAVNLTNADFTGVLGTDYKIRDLDVRYKFLKPITVTAQLYTSQLGLYDFEAEIKRPCLSLVAPFAGTVKLTDVNGNQVIYKKDMCLLPANYIFIHNS
ncbi:MAG: hypothetical protein WAO12_07780 [Venatoribacter sp.]